MIDYILKFEYSDIKYIIVENKSEEEEIVKIFSEQNEKIEFEIIIIKTNLI